MWIYVKIGERPSFILPDRNKYVNMEKTFLSSYMKLLVKVSYKYMFYAYILHLLVYLIPEL
jgi:hypothetical protein